MEEDVSYNKDGHYDIVEIDSDINGDNLFGLEEDVSYNEDDHYDIDKDSSEID